MHDGKSFTEMRSRGHAGYPAFTLGTTPFEQDVMKAFRRRLPMRERSDYADYLRHFRLTPDVAASDFALLGLTGAKLPSDGFSVVDPLEDAGPPRDLFLEVAGYRYHANLVPAYEGADGTFISDPANRWDPNAVAIQVNGALIGYVNRLCTSGFITSVRDKRLTGFVERLNGRPDHPRAFVFARLVPSAERAAA